jgi:hypothetical protein
MLSLMPSEPVDGLGVPRFGSYAGAFATTDLTSLSGRFRPTLAQRLSGRKKWFYGFVATDEIAAMWAVADLRYLSNAFSMAVDLKTGEVLADESFVGLPGALAKVADEPLTRAQIRFVSPSSSFSVKGSEHALKVQIQLGLPVPLMPKLLRLDVSLWLTAHEPARSPLTVVSPVDGGIVNVTTKLAGVLADGTLETKGRTYSLRDAVGGFDHTHGYLARETAWRWAFVCGRLPSGEPFGLNLVEGFNESRDDVNENAVWCRGQLASLGRARFEFNRGDPLDEWRVKTTDGSLEMTLKPLAAHRETKDFGVVKSAFLQPMGLWSGWFTLNHQRCFFSNAPGVAEDQNVRW